MYIIRTPNQYIIQNFRNLVKETSKSYRAQKFVVTTPVSDGMLIYSVLTSGLIFLTNDEYDDFSTSENIILDNSPLRKTLSEMLFLVPESFDEKNFVDDLRELNFLRDSFIDYYDTYFIYTTTACNARCFYCFEENIKPIIMSPETADKVAEYIIKKSCGHKIRIVWFGGEPTLNIPISDRICDKLNNAGINFESKIISNGLLLTEDVVKKMVQKYHLYLVQVSMDGTGQMYDKIKAFPGLKQGESAYEKVCKNIQSLLENDVQIWIRLNIGSHNADSILPMIDELCSKFGKHPKFSIFPQVLNEGKYELNTSEARSHLFEVQKEAYKTQLNHNVPISQNRYSLPHLKLNSCYADNPSAIGISPDGKLYKCAENIAFTPSFGNIFESQKIDESKINCFTKKHDWKKCHDCVFYPSCLNLSMCSARQKECQPCHFDFKLWKTKSCMKDEWDKYQLSLKC